MGDDLSVGFEGVPEMTARLAAVFGEILDEYGLTVAEPQIVRQRCRLVYYSDHVMVLHVDNKPVLYIGALQFTESKTDGRVTIKLTQDVWRL
jgi:hypothetical protein